jgi:transcriptional regulator with XRE-family HTH domain
MRNKFGEMCREFRASRGLYLADQAEGTRVSVSTISAIERGTRSIPDGYPEAVAKWLGLSPEQARMLTNSAAVSSNVIEFRPKNDGAAALAFDLTRRLNELTPADIREIKKLLEEGRKIYE